jgi:hypothetical protein
MKISQNQKPREIALNWGDSAPRGLLVMSRGDIYDSYNLGWGRRDTGM